MPSLYPDAPTYPVERTGQRFEFPAGFVWGAGSSAYQNEGAPDADGKSPSIWDTFTKRAGQIPDDSDGSIACDSYHKYPDDARLLAEANLKAYRFSIAWTRVLPDGTGQVNPKGLDYYDRLIDALAERNIIPFVTAYHWDLPQILQDRGGWANRDMVGWFSDYAAVLAEHLGDRVKHWFVLNEPNIHGLMGYMLGQNAPGIADERIFRAVVHHQNLATGMAARAMRAARADLKIGTVISLQGTPPASNSDEDRLASQLMDAIVNRAFLDPVTKGTYPAFVEGQMEGDGLLHSEDMEIAKADLDFLGVNYYADFFARMDKGGPTISIRGGPDWLPKAPTGYSITDQGFYKTLVDIRDNYANMPVYISENGMADLVNEDGHPTIEDNLRVDYFRRHLFQLSNAIAHGCNVQGYFAWTIVDNFEWEWGYKQRYGLVALDRATGRRTPKSSYRFYADVAARNSVEV